MVQVFPNSRNVIPGRVKFSIDLRNSTDALVDAMAAEVKAFADQVAQGTVCRCTSRWCPATPRQLFQSECVEAVGRAAGQAGLQPHARCLRLRARRGLHGLRPAA